LYGDGMKFFGATIQSEAIPRTGVPVGQRCFSCEKPIIATDSGFILPYTAEGGETTDTPWHRSCLLECLGLTSDDVS
jgi:hypothetical protein